MFLVNFSFLVEASQILYDSMNSEISNAMNIMKNETLYNLTIESPLLRDADILDTKSITTTWRGSTASLPSQNYELIVDASIRKGEELKGWVGRKVNEVEGKLNSAEGKLALISCFEKEGLALETLGENIL